MIARTIETSTVSPIRSTRRSRRRPVVRQELEPISIRRKRRARPAPACPLESRVSGSDTDNASPRDPPASVKVSVFGAAEHCARIVIERTKHILAPASSVEPETTGARSGRLSADPRVYVEHRRVALQLPPLASARGSPVSARRSIWIISLMTVAVRRWRGRGRPQRSRRDRRAQPCEAFGMTLRDVDRHRATDQHVALGIRFAIVRID